MIRKILSIILLLVWSIFIFARSSSDGTDSTSQSSKLIINVVELFTDIKRDSTEMNNIIEKYSFPVRKCAHFTEYLILAICVMNVLYSFGIKKYTLLICSIYCILYAISDEVHQLFSDGRSGQISDVLLDSSSSLITSYLYYKYINWRKHE